ncbi:MAG: glycerol-3-phosphate acyltransferase [Verrucomicrobia bacterium]|nr:glycerol-3-phosphate acyltransferase [Verrucomicrobiota bacterium]
MADIIGQTATLNRGMLVFLCSYALGCFTTGYYLVRWRTGTDIRQWGSGSVGAKNVGRFLGRLGFIATASLDFAKGALAVWATLRAAEKDQLAVIAMVAVVAGHIWPLPLGFRGGKGVATSLGAILFLDFRLALIFLGLFLVTFVLLRKTVWSGLSAFALLPTASFLLGLAALPLAGVSVVVTMILIAHRRNLFPEMTNQSERRCVQADLTQLPK